jgi:DNA-directed RNA polymerase subunit K/omega
MNINENLLSSLSEETNREIEENAARKKPLLPKGSSLKRDFLAEDFRDQIENIYEAIIVMSQRARQIGQKQARIIEQFLAAKVRSDNDDIEEDAPVAARPFEDDDDDAPRLPQFEKPTVLAMNELLKGDLKYRNKNENVKKS